LTKTIIQQQSKKVNSFDAAWNLLINKKLSAPCGAEEKGSTNGF
jgi:hypothetical protein